MGQRPLSYAARKDHCEVCEQLVDRKTLVYQERPHLRPGGSQNRLPYSEYSASGWSCTADDNDTTAIGNTRAIAYPLDDDSVVEEGIQSWDGAGLLETTVAIDCSSWSTVVMAAFMGPHQLATVKDIEVVIKARYDTTSYEFTTYPSVRSGCGVVWGVLDLSTVAEAHRSALYFGFDIQTGVDTWYATRMQLEADVTTRGPHLATAGSSKIYTSDQEIWSMSKVCPKCRYDSVINIEDETRDIDEDDDTWEIPEDLVDG